MAELTPMMQQFYKIKQQYPDALLLFRCGDFYETYAQDAVKAAKILNITLTKRNNGQRNEEIAMAGFPYHALDTYLPKLVREGMRVAICDQLEDPKLTKKLVKRGVTELVTPGVSYSETTLNGKENNFVAAICWQKNSTQNIGIALLDISTGEFLVAQGNKTYIDKLLSNFQPKEVLFQRGLRQQFTELFGDRFFTFELDDWMLTPQSAEERLLKQFKTQSLKGFGVDTLPLAVNAAGAILHYLDMTQHLTNQHILALSRIEEEQFVWLDRFTIANLELFQTRHQDAVTLIDILDHTITPMGARMLRRWIAFPLKQIKPIQDRQAVVQHFFRDPELTQQLQSQLKQIGNDIERLAMKVATSRIMPRDVYQIATALEAIKQIQALAANTDTPQLNALAKAINPLNQLQQQIRHTISPDAPALLSKPGYIRQGVDQELDELRNLQKNSREYLTQLQQKEAAATGIQSLKIGFNNVFGYYLEVRNTYKELVPATWIRKQTLAQAERYVTEELKKYEEQILGAEDRCAIIEQRIYNELLVEMMQFVPQLQNNAQTIAQIDCLLSFYQTAELYHYACPVVNDSLIINIKQGRHPVIEQQLPLGEKYVPNDILLDNNQQQIIILTGPNMAGKSALLRQTALITLMAQIGSFVPAESAQIGIVDKIFTRVGASDNLSLGESTFMVEMNEAAAILNNLSERSLVLFDELGRGTSTYDGISIAWAIVEYIHDNRCHAKTLFATHYHELNEMEKSFKRIRNFNVSVKEIDGKVIFLRKIQRGGAEHSFGIHVAKLAGIPQSIIHRSEQILTQLESDTKKEDGNKTTDKLASISKPTDAIQQNKNGYQLSIFQLDDPVLEQIRDQIMALDINNLTPLEALNSLNQIRHILKS